MSLYLLESAGLFPHGVVLFYGFLKHSTLVIIMDTTRYSPPWADISIIGVAGSSGSGKTSLAEEIISSLDLPWVVILSMVCRQDVLWGHVLAKHGNQDSFYKPLTLEQHAAAHRNEYDLDAPEALDFDLLVDCLSELKQG